MKKAFFTVATCCTFAGSAYAQNNVTLFGIVDTGIGYTNNVQTSPGKGGSQVATTDGNLQGSRWGIKGQEDLGNGVSSLERLKNTSARWNVLANTVKMTPFDMDHNGELYRYLQSWDGYPAERGRILDRLAASSVANPVSLSGDIHSYLVSDVVRNVGDKPNTALMTEFVGTSISSVWPEPLARPMYDALPHNPHVNFYDSSKRGYMRCTFTKDQLTTDLRTIDTVARAGGKVTTERSFVVENGEVGAKDA